MLAVTTITQLIFVSILIEIQQFGVVALGQSTITSCHFAPRSNELTFICTEELNKDQINTIQSSTSIKCPPGSNNNVNLNHIKHLQFDNCNFTFIPPKLLDRFESLQSLNIAALNLWVLVPKDIPHRNLDTLDASKNRIDMLDAWFLDVVSFVKHLDLSDNKIVSVEANTFRQPTTVQSLNLDGNFIAKALLNGLKSLRSLRLSGNDIHSISVDLQINGELLELDISFNRIGVLRVGDFSQLRKLTHLNISNARIDSIELGTFSPLINLKMLDVSNNQLIEIDFAGFLPPRKYLRALYLNGNYLTELSDHVDFLFPRLDELLIADNQFNCTYLGSLLLTIRDRCHAVNVNHKYDHKPNIGGIDCEPI